MLTVGGITGSMQIEAVIDNTEVYQDLFLTEGLSLIVGGYRSGLTVSTFLLGSLTQWMGSLA